MKNKISKNIEDTEKIAKEFLIEIFSDFDFLKKDRATIVGLYGDLGTGKTTFTQAIAKNLNIKRKVNSPTFVIMKKYIIPKNVNYKNFLANKTKPVFAGENFHNSHFFKQVFHIDAYRLKNEKELLMLGWQEMISSKDNLIFIEWPENIIKAMPKKHHKISISHTREGHRKFKI